MTSEYKEHLFNKIVNIMYINPSIFPIVQVLHDRYVDEKSREFLIKHSIETLIGLKVVFNHYYDKLISFWYVGDQAFINSFDKLLTVNVLTSYFGSFVTKDDYDKYKNFIKSL